MKKFCSCLIIVSLLIILTSCGNNDINFHSGAIYNFGSDSTSIYQNTVSSNSSTETIVSDNVSSDISTSGETISQPSNNSETSSNIPPSTPEKSKEYGVKWKTNDSNDLGQRCFDAVGLTAAIGIGSTDGKSDFDNIYPWCDMKRCNIKANPNGTKSIIYEGESGFALDGSNGDVFVRIPKFYIKQYTKDGYEYRTISATGKTVHPAFVENGKVLDEIFIGAYEGYKGNDSKLHSISNVIPTSNITPSEFLTAATSNGNGYTLYDLRSTDVIWTLFAIEYGCRNTNNILGYGFSDYMQPIQTSEYLHSAVNKQNTNVFIIASRHSSFFGIIKKYMPVGSNITVCKNNDQLSVLTQAKLLSIKTAQSGDLHLTFDGNPINIDTTCFIGSAACTTNFCETSPSPLKWHTGRSAFVAGSTTKNPIRYRWIENIFGSLWEYTPDVMFKNCEMFICSDIKDYSYNSFTNYKSTGTTFSINNDNGTKSDSTGKNYWITSLSDQAKLNGISFGQAFDKNLTSKQAFGAYYYVGNGAQQFVANGGGFDHLYRCNMLTSRAWINSDTKWFLYGGRLIYKNA